MSTKKEAKKGKGSEALSECKKEKEHTADTKESSKEHKSSKYSKAACSQDDQAWKCKYVQLSADFENFRNRSERERLSWRSSGQKELLLRFLTIVDDIDRAVVQMQLKGVKREQSVQSWIDGVVMIQKAVGQLLSTYNVVEMKDVSIFDPMFHEAVARVESSEKKSGEIVTVFEKGYLMNKIVLRPAKVSVAK